MPRRLSIALTTRLWANDSDNGSELKTGGLQGKHSRFDLDKHDDGTQEVTDKETSETSIANKVRDGLWKILLKGKDDKKTCRYFNDEAVERNKVRRLTDSVPWEELKKRNNVEATIFLYCFHTRNNKTRYRGLIKHTLQAIARCAWINLRRICIYKQKMALQMI